MAFGDLGTVIAYPEAVVPYVFENLDFEDPLTVILLFQQRVYGIVDYVAEDSAKLPRRHCDIRKGRIYLDVTMDVPAFAHLGFRLENGIDGGDGSLQVTVDFLDVGIQPFHVSGGLAVFFHFDQAVNDLKLVEKIMSLFTQCHIQAAEIADGVFGLTEPGLDLPYRAHRRQGDKAVGYGDQSKDYERYQGRTGKMYSRRYHCHNSGNRDANGLQQCYCYYGAEYFPDI